MPLLIEQLDRHTISRVRTVYLMSSIGQLLAVSQCSDAYGCGSSFYPVVVGSVVLEPLFCLFDEIIYGHDSPI